MKETHEPIRVEKPKAWDEVFKQEFIDMIMHSINHIDCGACPAEKFCQEQCQHGYITTNNSCRDIVGAWLESEAEK